MGTAKEAWEALRDQQNHEEQQALRGKFTVRPVEPETAPEESSVETGLSFDLKSLIHSDKKQIENISKSIVQKVADGEVDCFKAYIANKKMLEIATLNEKNLRPYVNSKGIQKGGLTLFNIEFTSKSDPSKWNYDDCNDPEYTKMLTDLKELQEKIKKKQTVLQNMDKQEERVDTTTGETYTVYPAVKTTGSENFSCSIK